jgi:hypothetical protein
MSKAGFWMDFAHRISYKVIYCRLIDKHSVHVNRITIYGRVYANKCMQNAVAVTTCHRICQCYRKYTNIVGSV